MVKAQGVIAEYESIDGLRIEVLLRVRDEQGAADVVAEDILDGIAGFVAEIDAQIEADHARSYGWGV